MVNFYFLYTEEPRYSIHFWEGVKCMLYQSVHYIKFGEKSISFC